MSEVGRWVSLLSTLTLLGAPLPGYSSDELDIELMEFIGMWEDDEPPQSLGASIKPTDSKRADTPWIDPFSLPELDQTNDKTNRTESL